tara:strand:- start:304 stop:7293 length:6990 start_codon:yes stop_codon:yes gene_type:complete
MITSLQLKNAGFNDDQITHWVDQQRGMLKKAGYSDMEINKAYGLRINKTEELNHIVNDIDTSLSLNIHKNDTTNLEKSNSVNTVVSKKDVTSNNALIDKNIKDKNEFAQLSAKEQMDINNMLSFAYTQYKDEDGRKTYINNYLTNHFPDLVPDDIKLQDSNDATLIESSVNDKPIDTANLDNIEAKKILTGEVGYNNGEYTYSKEFEKEENKRKITETAESLEKEIQEKRFKVLDPYWTTGKESTNLLKYMSEYYGWNEQQMNNFNLFVSFVSALESDNRNIYSKDGEAKGLFQFRDSSLTTALNRFVNMNTKIDNNFQVPKWVQEAYEHTDATALPHIDHQRALTIANFFMMAKNSRLNRSGSDEWIRKIADGDVDAMKYFYKHFHHADYIKGEDGVYSLRNNEKLNARVDEYLDHWNDDIGIGFENPKLAMIPSQWNNQDGFMGKVDAFLSYYAGGQGNESAFLQGYKNSVTGKIDAFNEFLLDNPDASDLDKDSKMKEMFMYGEDQTFATDIVSAAVTLLNDSPYMVAGCFAAAGTTTALSGGTAAPAAPIVCMGGAFALPEVLRHTLTEGMLDGRWNNFSEFWEHFVQAKTAEVGAKTFALGAVTGTAGKIATVGTKKMGFNSKVQVGSRLTAEIYTMTEMGARMEGHVPTMRDFATTAVLIFGFHATVGQVTNLVNLYKDHALHPKDIKKIADKHPEILEQLKNEEKPDFLAAHQKKLYEKLEETKKTKLLPPPKFMLNEKVNISPEGTEKGIIIGKETIGNEPFIVVKTETGNTLTIKESNARKVDAIQEIIVDIKKDGKLEIKEKESTNDTTGSKDGKTTFESKQENGEYSKDIVELKIENNEIINKDGSKYKYTESQALTDLNTAKKVDQGGGKIETPDGKVTSDSKILIVNKYYPKIHKEFNKKNNKGEPVWENKPHNFKDATDIVNKVFNGLTNKYKRVTTIFAKSKGVNENIDIMVGKFKGGYISFSRKAYESLIKFTDKDGKVKKAKMVTDGPNKPLVFLHPTTNKVIGMLMPRKTNKGDKISVEAESYFREFYDKESSSNFYYNKRSRESDEGGIPNDPFQANKPPPKSADAWKRFFDNTGSLDYYSIVSLVEGLLGKLPNLKNLNNARYIGVFRHQRKQDLNKPLREQADIIIKRALQDNPAEFLKTLTHELGHLIDFLPQRSMAKGNILGHIAGLKKYMNDWIAGRNDGAKPLSTKEIAELKKQAETWAKNKEKEINKEIETELNITPEKILDIFRDANIRDKIDPEFYAAFVKLDGALKKDIVKDAMKGLINNHIKALVDKANGKKVNPKLTEEANQKFKELFEKEISNRNLVSKELIMRELKALTMKWHPYDRATADKKYNEYRDSPAELMAEFMMAMLLQPNWVRVNAPRSYELLMYHFSNRPEVKALYTKIQNGLNGGKDGLWGARETEIKNEWVDQELIAREKITQEKILREKTGLDDFNTEVIDSFAWILDRLKLDTQRGNSELAKDVKYYIENNRYVMAEMSAYRREINVKIFKQLEKYGYNKQDLSWIMMLENLAKSEQRSGKITWKFYPFPKDANGNVKPEYKELQKFEGNYLEIFEKKVQQSPELYKIAQEFFNLRQRNIIKRIMEFPVFSAKEKAEMAENYYYLTFQPFEKVMKRLDTFGAGAISTKGIKQTQGTFEAFMSPFDATVAKDLMMLAHLKRQNVIGKIVEFMETYKSTIEKTDMVLGVAKENKGLPIPVISKPKYRGKNIDPVIPKGMERITFQRNGKLETYDINKTVYEALQNNALYQSKVLKVFSHGNSIFRRLLTEYNPLFWIWNWGFRDMRRSFLLLPNGKIMKSPITRLQYVKEVFKSLKPAFKSIYGEGTAVTKHMEKNGFLIALEEGYRGEAGMAKHRLGLDQESFALKKLIFEQYENVGKFEMLWDNTAGKLLESYANLGRVLERSHKIAGYKVLKDQVNKGELKNMSEKEMMQIVQSEIGSPNFLRQGKMNPLLNNLFLFFNANKEGYRGEITAFKKDKSGVGSRFLAYSLIPKTIEKLAVIGVFGVAMQQLYQAVPEYDRHNFNIWVIGETDNRPVYIRIPLDFTSQLITSLYSMGWEEAFGIHNKATLSEKVGSFWSAVNTGLPQVTPFIGMIKDVGDLFTGKNVYNKWDSLVMDETIMNLDINAKNNAKLKESFKYIWNSYGGALNAIHKFKMKFKDDIAEELTDLTGMPFIDPLIKKFLKVGNEPVMDEFNELNEIEKNLENEVRYELKNAIYKMQEGNFNFTKAEQEALVLYPDLTHNNLFLEQMSDQAGVSELLKAWITADKKERLLLLKAIKNVVNANPDYEIKFKNDKKNGILKNNDN